MATTTYQELSPPECLLSANTVQIGESVVRIENENQAGAKAGADQTPRHLGQDGTFASQVLT